MTAKYQPAIAEVLAAVQSLYADEIRPMGRILLRRLREQAASEVAEAAGSDLAVADFESVGMIDPKYLRASCESCRSLVVAGAVGKEYSVELSDVRGIFVDPCSALDPYPASLWTELAVYIASLDEEASSLPSGRYACAQVLASRGLPFLQGRSLGEVCHIVQLAIAQQQLLGHANGGLVPYGRSETCLKLRCAVRQQPLSIATGCEPPFATWRELGPGLHAVLATSRSPLPGVAAISNIKSLFRSELGLVLSETVLGYARIGDLLQDARLSHICSVHATGNGQTLVCLHEALPLLCSQVPCTPLAGCAGSNNSLNHGSSTCASKRLPLPHAPAAPLGVPALPAACGFYFVTGATDLVHSDTCTRDEEACSARSACSVSSTFALEPCLPEAVHEKQDQLCSSDSACASTIGDADSVSESGDSMNAMQSVNVEEYGYVIKNGFLEVAPRRRHVRSRSA